MLRAYCRGVREVRDEEKYWKHHTYLESHIHCKPSARGGGEGRDGGGRVQAAFVWLSTQGLRENFQSEGEVDIGYGHYTLCYQNVDNIQGNITTLTTRPQVHYSVSKRQNTVSDASSFELDKAISTYFKLSTAY